MGIAYSKYLAKSNPEKSKFYETEIERWSAFIKTMIEASPENLDVEQFEDYMSSVDKQNKFVRMLKIVDLVVEGMKNLKNRQGHISEIYEYVEKNFKGSVPITIKPQIRAVIYENSSDSGIIKGERFV